MIGELRRWRGTVTLLAPMSHNDEVTLSTETKFRRMAYTIEGRKVEIPVYSGNAYRGRLRRLAMRRYLDALGVTECSPKLHYLLHAGGSLEKGSKQTADPVGARREVRRLIPPLSLFGTALESYLVSGKLQVGIALPICRELVPYTEQPSDRSIWDCLTTVFYTRRDDLEDKPEEAPVQQMKYQIEVLVPGTVLQHTFALLDASAIEASCFGDLMRAFEAEPLLGGMAAKGHGRVHVAYEPAWPDPTPYREWLSTAREECRQFLDRLERLLG